MVALDFGRGSIWQIKKELPTFSEIMSRIMLMPDVNIFVYAFRRESKQHIEHKNWLETRLVGPEIIGLSELVLSGFLRIVTNHRIFIDPTTPEAARAFCETLFEAPATTPLRPSSSHWPIFAELCRATEARANTIPDAYHAALAIEHDATLVTTDSGFARFPQVRLLNPLEMR